jgi:cation-transporting ATPase 13A3/4/5
MLLEQRGLTTEEYQQRFDHYGSNQTAIPEKSIGKILVDEILSPFYMFQVFSIVLWMLEPYYIYSGVIFFTSLASVVITLQETR